MASRVLDDHAIRVEMGPFEFGLRGSLRPNRSAVERARAGGRVMGRGEKRTFHSERSAYP